MAAESRKDLLERIRILQDRLDEAEETLRALRSGEVDALVATGPDGHDRVYTLRGADEAYRLLVQGMAEGALTLGLDGLILFSNEQFATLVGLPLERVTGSRIQDLVAPQDAETVTALLYGRAGATVELGLKTDAGAAVPVYLSVKTLFLDGVEFACAIVTDLTEQKRSQALRDIAVRERERERTTELLALMEAVPAAILVARDAECRTMTGNRKAHELLRVPRGRNLSLSAPEIEKPMHFRVVREGRETPLEEMPLQMAARTGEPVPNFELDVVFDDGTHRTLLGDAVPLLDEAGHPRGAVAAFVDITDRKRVDNRIREAQKMESIGVLAGGVAHDFNNLLTGIVGNASLVLESMPGWDPNRENIQALIESSQRAADLTRQLLAYAGKGKFIVTQVDLSDLVQRMLGLLRASVPSTIEIRFDFHDRQAIVEADSGQIQQIVTNLVLNACEAIGASPGVVFVQTSTRSVDESFIRQAHLDIAPGTYASLEVHDTGCGMDAATIGRIFEPFFTTKFQGRGLGLSAVQGIVNAHHGAIIVYSHPGEGSRFTVLLPAARADRPSSQSAEMAEQTRDLSGHGTVLVVDDEATVRHVAKAVLERHGYTVLLAQNGAEALQVFSREDISLVLLDLTMPGMTGEDVFKRIRAIRPEVPVLLSSGYNQIEAIRRFAGLALAGFIGKPYSAADLAAKVKSVLGG